MRFAHTGHGPAGTSQGKRIRYANWRARTPQGYHTAYAPTNTACLQSTCNCGRSICPCDTNAAITHRPASASLEAYSPTRRHVRNTAVAAENCEAGAPWHEAQGVGPAVCALTPPQISDVGVVSGSPIESVSCRTNPQVFFYRYALAPSRGDRTDVDPRDWIFKKIEGGPRGTIVVLDVSWTYSKHYH